MDLLERIRPHNPALNITGGEPLLYPDVSRVLRRARELAFRPLLLSTNGLLIRRVIDELPLLDHVVISLDSLDRDVADTMMCVRGSGIRIIDNIRRCAAHSHKYGFAMSLHAVVSPETIDGIEDVLTFCEDIGATLSLSPEHGLFHPLDELRGSAQYTDLIDRLIELKADGRPIACSFDYLRAIREFDEHRCFPYLSPRVEPDGRVYFPCQRIGDRAVYLQDYPSLYELMREEADLTNPPDCSQRCFLACYMEVDAYLSNPFSILTEPWMRRALSGNAGNPPSTKRTRHSVEAPTDVSGGSP
jgi:MoaA/NifB/PqqE/SkfB family radical SAM enzyme